MDTRQDCVECEQSSLRPDVNAGNANAAKEDLLDPETFSVPHPELEGPRIVIEFCDRCRWMRRSRSTSVTEPHNLMPTCFLDRATWTQTELFLTFANSLSSITLMPRNAPETAGRWRVWLWTEPSAEAQLVWDRKIEEGFGELKLLKQRIRNVLQPGKSLGHSDRTT